MKHPTKPDSASSREPQVDLLQSDHARLLHLSQSLGLALSSEEMNAIRDYFVDLGRNPTNVELQTFGQTWSEHCFHKTFKGRIVSEDGELIVDSLFGSYISRPVSKMNPSWCLDTFTDNAGILLFEEQGETTYAIAAKVETHNHPSAIEPFGGAATGVGGVIRDVLGVWAQPIALTDVLCFGPLDHDTDEVPEGVNHPSYIFDGVVAGIGNYGNNMGIPTVNGAIFFDESYVGNVVVYCGCIGILPMHNFSRNTAPGDIALLAGGKTGRDGIHGVTFASAELTEESQKASLSAVQVPNPLEEEKLRRAVLRVRDLRLASAITDLGGGGLSCAAGEMANRASCGARIDIDEVPLKETNPPMRAWEIWISESQERMLLSVPKANLDSVLQIFRSEDVLATPVGLFIPESKLEGFSNGKKIVDLDLSFLYGPPRTTRTARIETAPTKHVSPPEPEELRPHLLKVLTSPNVVSREPVIRSYDHEVQGRTVIKPLQGKYAGPNDASVIRPLWNSWKGIAVSSGMNPFYGKLDPYWMAASAIDEAIRNNTTVGGRRIALLDNFTWGSPEKPDRVGTLTRACQACYDFSMGFKAPFVSGKDSLYNESALGQVTPTLLITAIGMVPDVRHCVSMELKQPGDLLYLIGATYAELGGSQYFLANGTDGGQVPKVRIQESTAASDLIIRAIDNGVIRACHDLSEGGLAVAAPEMAIGGGMGLDLDISKMSCVGEDREDYKLFSESNGRYLVEISPDQKESFEDMTDSLDYTEIGRVTESKDLTFRLRRGRFSLDLERLTQAWKQPLEV